MLGVRTWYQHGLASHDEDNLHRAKLRHVETAALHDGITKFVCEYKAEKEDCSGLCDVRRGDDVLVAFHVTMSDGLLNGKNEECGLEASCNTSHNCGDTHDDISLYWCRCNTNDPDLKA